MLKGADVRDAPETGTEVTESIPAGDHGQRTLDGDAAATVAQALGGWRRAAAGDTVAGNGHDAAGAPQQPAGAEEQAAFDPSVLRDDGRLFRSVPPRAEPTRRGSWRGFRSIVASLLRQRRRVLLSMVAVALGVGYLAGSLSLLHRVGVGLEQAAGIGHEPADLVLEGTVTYSTPLEEVRRLIPDSLRQQLEAIPGIEATVARLEDVAVIVAPDGRLTVPLGLTERPVGANWSEVPALNPYKLVEGGRAPTAPDEVVIDATTARRASIVVGDRVLVNAKAATRPFTVTGLVEPAEGELPAGTSLALFTTSTARELFDRASDNNAIAIQAEPDADIPELRERIEAVLPNGVEVSSPAAYAQHRRASLTKSFALIRALLLGFAVLALAMGTFTVANSNTLLFARRRRSLAALRLVGAAPGQLLGAAVTEAAVVAAFASLVGLPLGLLFARLIELALGSLGTAVPLAGSAITVPIAATAVGIGILTTILATIVPARAAARTPAIVAVTDTHADQPVRSNGWIGPAIGCGAAIALGGVAGGGVGTATTLGSAVGAGIGATAGLLLAVVWLTVPRALAAMVSSASRLALGDSRGLRSLVGAGGRSARARLAGTTWALFAATFVLAAISTISSSFIASVSGQVDQVLTADLVVDSGTFTRGGLPATLVAELREVPGVDAVSGLRIGQAIVANSSTRLTALDGSTMFEVLDLRTREGSASRLGADDVALSSRFARDHHLSLGSTAYTDFNTGGVLPLQVSVIYDAPTTLIGDVIVNTSLLQRVTPSSVDYAALVALDPTQRAAAADGVRQVAGAAGFDRVLTPEQLVSQRSELLRGFQDVIQWMLLFSVLLAVLGVANTLLLGVNERRRELGLLRAVGASRQQIVRLVTTEAVVLTLIGSAAGIAAGVAAAFAAVRTLAGLGLGTFALPTLLLVAIVGVALTLGLVGAAVPAWRAASAGIAEAVADPEGDLRRAPRRSRHVASSSPTLEDASTGRHPSDRVRPSPAEHSSPEQSDEQMINRCYNCGSDPGDTDTCSTCGAPQLSAPMDMFATAPATPSAAAGAAQPAEAAPSGAHAEREPVTVPPVDLDGEPRLSGRYERIGADLWATGPADPENDPAVQTDPDPFDAAPTAEPTRPTTRGAPTVSGLSDSARYGDIVDAAVVEDDDEAETHAGWPRPPRSSAAPPTDPLEDMWAASAPPPPPPRRTVDSPPPRYTDEPPPQAPPRINGQPDSGQRVGQDPAGAARSASGNSPLFGQHARLDDDAPDVEETPPAYVPYTPPPTPPAPPPEWGTPPVAHSGESTLHGGSGAAVVPSGSDEHGLAPAIGRLLPASQQRGAVALTVLGALLTDNEMVTVVVVGTSLGLPTAAALTTTRLVVVSERRWKPSVEQFVLRPGLQIHGRHIDETAALTIQDGDRLLTIDQISDVAAAVELATATRARASGSGF